MTARDDFILIVEDNTQWPKNFIEIVKRLGETKRFEISDIDGFFARFKTPTDFEPVSTCIIDLELAGDADAADSAVAGDVKGMTDVLPYIRAKAPWISIACISRYLKNESMVAKLSTSDFDFFAAKSVIGAGSRTHQEFNTEMWRNILHSMRVKRVASLTGRSPLDVERCLSRPPSLIVDDATRDALNKLALPEGSFREGISVLGLDSSELTVEALQPGFSGLQVSRIRARGLAESELTSADWLLKWGRPVYKLTAEALAHQRCFRRGLDRALQIPQFHSNAIAWDGAGYLAYAFEKDAQTALQIVLTGEINILTQPLCELATALYSSSRTKAVNTVEAISDWTSLQRDEVAKACSHLSSHIQDVTWSLVHGDLHLRNIFIRKGRPTLIDFARSAYGPIALDAGKLLIDTFVCAPPDVRRPRALTVEAIVHSDLKAVYEPFRSYLQRPEDASFLQVVLRALSVVYQGYSDVSTGTKELLRALVAP